MLGLPFAFADFFGRTAAVGPPVAALYRREFRQTVFGDAPRLNVTVHIMCAPTEEEALFLASSRRFQRAARNLGLRAGLMPPEEIAAQDWPAEIRQAAEESAVTAIDGDPEQVRSGLIERAKAYETTDVGIVTNCFSFEARVRSYELVAAAFGLSPLPEGEGAAHPPRLAAEGT
jgi:alkanesulfonate monooxygenase SsuD/methylene tetrahydromethanopterin reductase-like flavin-dependent oxidoreductase (luciferase family)